MKWMVFLLVVMVGLMVFFDKNGLDAETAYRIERKKEQDKILVELESLNDPHVSQFVRD